MGSHPLNLAVRFALELSALAAVGAFGWARASGPLRWVLVIALPIAFMTLWATFTVPDDPSRSGRAPVPVPGLVRLLLELGLFGAAVACLFAIGSTRLAIALAATTVVHYAVSWDRIAWLLRR